MSRSPLPVQGSARCQLGDRLGGRARQATTCVVPEHEGLATARFPSRSHTDRVPGLWRAGPSDQGLGPRKVLGRSFGRRRHVEMPSGIAVRDVPERLERVLVVLDRLPLVGRAVPGGSHDDRTDDCDRTYHEHDGHQHYSTQCGRPMGTAGARTRRNYSFRRPGRRGPMAAASPYRAHHDG